MAVARGITIRPSSQNFRIEADFVDNLGATLTTGTFTASVSEVQDDGTLRAIDFNGSPPTVCATAATVPTTGTISLTNRPSGNTSRAYWSATFAGTNLTKGGVYLVEFNVPSGVTQPRPKLIQFGGADGDVMPNPTTGNVPVDVQTIKTQAVTCSAGVTVLASVGTAATSTAQTGDSFDRIGANGANLTGITNARLDLTQAVPTSNTAETLGDALNAARAQGFGKWVLTGTSLVLYANDGTTAVRSFTLNSATAPTSRT